MPRLTRLFVRIFIPITTLPITAVGLSGCETTQTPWKTSTVSEHDTADGLPPPNDRERQPTAPHAVQAYLNDLNRLEQNRPSVQTPNDAPAIRWIDARSSQQPQPDNTRQSTPPTESGTSTPSTQPDPTPRVLVAATQPQPHIQPHVQTQTQPQPQPGQPTVVIEGAPDLSTVTTTQAQSAPTPSETDLQAEQIQALMQSIEAIQAQADVQGPDDSELAIERMELCRKVSGYGIYEPFSELSFRAGREQKVIVYVELSGFEPRVMNDGYLETRLTKSVELFNEADGTSVWRRPEARIVDRSRNHRRDFFVVQMVTLPASLGLGRYRLKVRLRDEATGEIAERGLSLQIVEDASRPAAIAEPVTRTDTTTAQRRRSDHKQRELLEELQRVIGGIDSSGQD